MAERTAELAAANRELEAFISAVSHDLRAPLRAIAGFTQALEEDFGVHLDPRGGAHLSRIQAATRRMQRMIDELLRLARVSRPELHRDSVDLSALAAAVASELREAGPRRDVEFHIPDGLVAIGDAALLRIVLDNLLGNAWKYTGKKRRARIEFGAFEEGDSRVFFVRDDGVGFDPAQADKLFAPFGRLHPASDFEGTGVGLAMVQRAIHRHGGRVWAEGSVNGGATFYFTLGSRDGTWHRES